VRISLLVNTISICQWEDLSMGERNACNSSCLMWKPSSCTTTTKTSQTTSWVHVHLLPWAQHRKWIPIGSMGCVHTNQGRPTFGGCGNSSCVRNVVEKNGEDSQKVEKINQAIN
jgi:hypothetical protein